MTSPQPPAPDATPSAKELAKARGVNLADVAHDGARITKSDVKACIRRCDAAATELSAGAGTPTDADAPAENDTPADPDADTALDPDADLAPDPDADPDADADPDVDPSPDADPSPDGPGANTAYIVVAEMMLNGARYPTGSRLVVPAAAAGAMLRRGQLRLAD